MSDLNESSSNGLLVVFLIVIVLSASGCVSFQGSNDYTEPVASAETSNPENGTLVSKTESGTISTTPARQNEYVRSGQAFNNIVSERMEVHRTKILNSRAFTNNSVRLTIGLYDDTGKFADGSLRASAMDLTQAVATTIDVRTTPNETIAMENGTDGPLYLPKTVNVRVKDTAGSRVGSFEINPRLARAYMDHRFGTEAFAEDVLRSLDLNGDISRGNKSPEWYLNLSQLRNWGLVYIEEVQRSSNPEEHGYDVVLPTEGITPKPDSFSLHHEIENWSADEYGQYATSAEATIYGSYWRSAAKSWAMPPERIMIYIHVHDKDDLKSHMDRKHVYELLSAENINQTTLTKYQESSQTKFVEDDE